jgi:hypothetical protein
MAAVTKSKRDWSEYNDSLVNRGNLSGSVARLKKAAECCKVAAVIKF